MGRNTKQLVESFHHNIPSFKWISGKWFLGDNEIKDVNKFLLVNSYCGTPRDVEIFKDIFIAMFGEDGDWPELPIITMAKELIANGYAPEKLAYPLTDKELKIINYLLVGKPEYGIFFYGVGGSGKSTICRIICKIFGDNNCCFTSLQDISRFNIQLENARLWFDDDISPLWNESRSSRFKPMITNGSTSFEAKGKTPRAGRYRCKCLFACNQPIKFDLTDTGMLRRIIYYRKNEKIQNVDNSLGNREWTQEELLDIVVKALSMDMTNWTKDFEEDTRRTIAESNSVWKYGMTSSYDAYSVACSTAGYAPYGLEKWKEYKEIFHSWFGDNGEDSSGNT